MTLYRVVPIFRRDKNNKIDGIEYYYVLAIDGFTEREIFHGTLDECIDYASEKRKQRTISHDEATLK